MQRPRPRVRRRRPRRPRRSGTPRCAAIGPASSSSTVRWIVTPVSLVAGEDRALDGRGAAPARQQRRVDVQPERLLEQPRRDVEPVRADDDRGRPPRGSSGFAGWCTGMPSRSAAVFAGGGASLRPRPRGASGRVSRKAISCRAASRSRTSAPIGAVAATAISHRKRDARPQQRERLLAVLRVGAVDDQHAVEVVELVLHDAGGVPLELEAHVVAVLDPCPRSSASSGARPARARPAARGNPRRPTRPPRRARRSRVDDGARPPSLRLEDEEAAEHADLGRGEPDALGVVHQLGHPLDEPAQVVVEVGDLVRAAAAARGRRTGGSARARAVAGPRLGLGAASLLSSCSWSCS